MIANPRLKTEWLWAGFITDDKTGPRFGPDHPLYCVPYGAWICWAVGMQVGCVAGSMFSNCSLYGDSADLIAMALTKVTLFFFYGAGVIAGAYWLGRLIRWALGRQPFFPAGFSEVAAESEAVAQPVRTRRSHVVAVMFCVGLGLWGGHRFYLRQYGWGLVYALFFWSLLPAVASIFDMFRLLAMTTTEFEQRYNAR